MTLGNVGILFRISKDVMQREGIASFIKQAFLFSKRSLFSYGTYYIYEKTLNETNKFEFTPKIQNFTLKIIYASSDVDELITEGFNFNSHIIIKERLNTGAIAFCIFVERELAHISWVAIHNKGNVDPILSASGMDWQNVASIGPCVTNLKYRGLGFYPYVLYKICKFLKGKNKMSAKITTSKCNTSSTKGINKAGFKICGEVRYLKLLRWKFLKEKQIKEST